MAALGDKIKQLDETARRLMQAHPESAEQTYEKQREINEDWNQLTAKANARKEKLLDSYDLQRFLADYRDLMSWINSMMTLVSSEELANDVTGAEALLERHQVLIQCFQKSSNFNDICIFRNTAPKSMPAPVLFRLLKHSVDIFFTLDIMPVLKYRRNWIN